MKLKGDQYMNIKYILSVSILSLLPGPSMAVVFNQAYVLTDNSYYSNDFLFFGNIITTTSKLTGFLNVSIDDTYTATIDYSNVLLNGNTFRPIDTLVSDLNGVSSKILTSGFKGEPDYLSYGNAALTPFPSICVECGYEMTLNLEPNSFIGNSLVLSYHEWNPYDTGEVHFELYVSQVPLPASIWLLSSGLIGLLSFASRKKIKQVN